MDKLLVSKFDFIKNVFDYAPSSMPTISTFHFLSSENANEVKQSFMTMPVEIKNCMQNVSQTPGVGTDIEIDINKTWYLIKGIRLLLVFIFV